MSTSRDITFRISTEDVGLTQKVTISLRPSNTYGSEPMIYNIISFLPGTKYFDHALKSGTEVLARGLEPLLRSALVANPYAKEVPHDYDLYRGTEEDLERSGDWLSKLARKDDEQD